MDTRYWSVAEMAEYFKVSSTLIYRLIKDGEIKAVRIGKRNYRLPSHVIEAIQDGGLFS